MTNKPNLACYPVFKIMSYCNIFVTYIETYLCIHVYYICVCTIHMCVCMCLCVYVCLCGYACMLMGMCVMKKEMRPERGGEIRRRERREKKG